jgi:hypothetical protein
MLMNFAQGDTAHFLFDVKPHCSFTQSTDNVNVFITATNYCGNKLDTIHLGKRPVITGIPTLDSLKVEILNDTISGCGDSATIHVIITNMGTDTTGNYNTLTVELPAGAVWASGAIPSMINGQIYTFNLSGGIAGSGTQNIQFIATDTSGDGVYNVIANVWVKQEVICGTDTCEFLQNLAEDTDTSQIIINNIAWPYHPSAGTDKELGTSVAVDNDGNVYAVGYFQGNITFDTSYSTHGIQDMYILKLDECGDILWSRQVGGSGQEYANKIIVDNAGDIIITGYFQQTVDFGIDTLGNHISRLSGGNSDLFVAKYNKNGFCKWVYTYGTGGNIVDVGNDMTVDDSDNVYVVGTVGSGNLGNVYVAKLDSNGGFKHENFEGFNDAMGLGITYCTACGTNAKILVTGQFNASNIFITEWDDGLVNFIHNDYSSITGAGQRIITDVDSVYVAGYKSSGVIRKIEIMKVPISNIGISTPDEITSGSATGNDVATDIKLDLNGNIYITGQFTSDTAYFPISSTDTTLVNHDAPCSICSSDNFIAKYSQANNTFIWVVQSGSTYGESSMGLSLVGNGFGYVTGAFQNTAIFGIDTLTAHAAQEMFIARVHDWGLSSAYQKTIVPQQKTLPIDGTVNIYPNPTNDKLNIDLSFSADTKTKIVLCNLLGNTIRTIDEGTYSSKHIVTDTYSLPNGIYLVRIELPDRTILKKLAIIK